jgi:hypothetical protein
MQRYKILLKIQKNKNQIFPKIHNKLGLGFLLISFPVEYLQRVLDHVRGRSFTFMYG